MALLWAVAAGFIAESPKPWASVLRLLGWALLWCVEPFVVLFVLGPIASATHLAVVAVPYLGGALAFGYYLFRHHRRKK